MGRVSLHLESVPFPVVLATKNCTSGFQDVEIVRASIRLIKDKLCDHRLNGYLPADGRLVSNGSGGGSFGGYVSSEPSGHN